MIFKQLNYVACDTSWHLEHKKLSASTKIIQELVLEPRELESSPLS
jgi:hypothetical protein